jgi:hypothetical protein
MTQADSVLSTPPTNTSAIDHPMMFPPRDPTRRRFLAVAAVASVVSAGTLAAATQAPGIPQAVTVPPASPALRTAIRQLAKAHGILIGAQANNEEAQAIADDWEKQNPMPASQPSRSQKMVEEADRVPGNAGFEAVAGIAQSRCQLRHGAGYRGYLAHSQRRGSAGDGLGFRHL